MERFCGVGLKNNRGYTRTRSCPLLGGGGGTLHSKKDNPSSPCHGVIGTCLGEFFSKRNDYSRGG